MKIHTVSKGETVESIAQLYSVNKSILAFNNDIKISDFLPEGMALAIVIPTLIHKVKSGETLTSISKKYDVSFEEIWRNNLFLNGRDLLIKGQELYIKTEKDIIGSFEVGGYAYPYIDRLLFNRSLTSMGAVMPFTYGFRPDGSLIKLNDEKMLERIKYYNVSPIMHLSTLTDNNNFSSELARGIFKDKAAQGVLLNNVLKNMEEKGYTALDIDFEFLGKESAGDYADFVAFFKENLNPKGYGVLTALAPKTSTNQSGVLYEGHDYKALGEAANSVLLMTYEWGYTYGPPMAVSPIKNVEKVINYALTQIPSKKIFLGISNYGYDFTLPYIKGSSKAKSLSTKEAFSIASETKSPIKFDNFSKAPYFNYTDGKIIHEVWFEDVRSLKDRLSLIPKYSLKGALYWNLDRQNTQNLCLINQDVRGKFLSVL